MRSLVLGVVPVCLVYVLAICSVGIAYCLISKDFCLMQMEVTDLPCAARWEL